MNALRLPSAMISVLIVFQLLSFAWGKVSLVPPSTFPAASTITTSVPSSTLTASGGGTNSSGTLTSTAPFPSLTGYSSCVTSCLAQGSALSNCTSEVEVNCFCTSNHFAKDIVNCISSACPQELSTAESLAQQFCNLASKSTSLSFPTPTSQPSSTAPPKPTGTSSSVPATTTSSKSATSSSLPSLTIPRILHIGGPVAAFVLSVSVIL